jgi:lipopolysaccharide export system protein LptA
MWTPRRIFLLVVGLIFFGSAYGVYAYFLGWIDGLPTLPILYAERAPYKPDAMPTVRAEGNPTAQRIRQAFGPSAPELRYYIKADSKAKGILVVGHEMTKPDAEGKVTITPCSVAIFGKTRDGKGVQEITTMHCDRAILQFDKPVKNYSEMEGRKIVAAELRADPDVPLYHPYKGVIRITNNRRSDDPDDLIEMKTRGPIFYRAEPEAGVPHVWTDNVLEVTDRANLPKGETDEFLLRQPTMTAQGMKLFLTNEPKEGKAPPPKVDPNKKPNPAAVTGVERVELLSNVTMNLWIDPSDASFMGGTPEAKPEAKKEKKERSVVQIRTLGSFIYDMPTDKARFDKAIHVDPSIPNYVQVTRQILGNPNRDMMTSDFLELQFRRKKPGGTVNPKGPAPTPTPASKNDKPSSPESQIDIESVHAWGTTVVMTSDSEDITAYGNDLKHDNLKHETVLSGERIIVVKDGNQITAKELILSGLDNRATQQAKVKGPGQIDVGQVDPITKEFVYTRQAQWDDWLTFSRISEQGRDLDLLTLTGRARFADKVNNQSVSAQQLRVWASAPAKAKAKEKDEKTVAPVKKESLPKVLLVRMEAAGSVLAHSPDLDVKNTDYLNVFFREVASLPGTEPKLPGSPNPPPPAILTSNNPMNPQNPMSPAPKKEEAKPPAKKRNPPIKLAARRIETWALTSGNKFDLDRVHCEDAVTVHQDGTEESPTGIDLTGKMLDLDHKPEGNILVVTGTKEVPGEVRFDSVNLIGEEITINQPTNTASIRGPGTVRLLSNTNLHGEKLANAKPLVVHWQDGMEFRGADQSILFDGKVQATQDDAKVLCESMQVMLDRVVWINHLKRPKQANPNDNKPKVDRVICDQQPKQVEPGGVLKLNPVLLIEEVRENGKLLKYNYIEAREFDLDNLTRKTVVPGPGVVKLMQLGPKDGLNDPAIPKKDKGEQEMKLTLVEFSRQMQARSNTNPQWARFFGPVEVIHLPANDPNIEFNRNKLPDRAVRLKCKEELIVSTQKEKDANNKDVVFQSLEAKGSVEVWADNFMAEASVVKYDQRRDTITFEGDQSLPAVIKKEVQRGKAPQKFEGRKIIYNRKTKEFIGEDGRSFSE